MCLQGYKSVCAVKAKRSNAMPSLPRPLYCVPAQGCCWPDARICRLRTFLHRRPRRLGEPALEDVVLMSVAMGGSGDVVGAIGSETDLCIHLDDGRDGRAERGSDAE